MSGAAILDCGHLPTLKPASAITVGYGIGSATGETACYACYACCAEKERAAMIATGRATLYLVKRLPVEASAPYAFWHYVTDWPGLLEFKCLPLGEKGAFEGARVSRHGGGFGSQRTDAWFNGPDGYVWHAINRGDNDLARCWRTRQKVRS